MTPQELIAFEDDIAAEFERGAIPFPVHLAGGNESQLIAYFAEHVAVQDYVLCTWRAHYHCLLKGVPPKDVKDAIVRGRSIALCFPRYRVLSSAIVGGICPLAVGLAFAIKRNKEPAKVHAFIGDMASYSGVYHECRRYCQGHDLPVSWIIEDNGKSVCTDTLEVWGKPDKFPEVHHYHYTLTKVHVGTGKWVRF